MVIIIHRSAGAAHPTDSDRMDEGPGCVVTGTQLQLIYIYYIYIYVDDPLDMDDMLYELKYYIARLAQRASRANDFELLQCEGGERIDEKVIYVGSICTACERTSVKGMESEPWGRGMGGRLPIWPLLCGCHISRCHHHTLLMLRYRSVCRANRA